MSANMGGERREFRDLHDGQVSHETVDHSFGSDEGASRTRNAGGQRYRMPRYVGKHANHLGERDVLPQYLLNTRYGAAKQYRDIDDGNYYGDRVNDGADRHNNPDSHTEAAHIFPGGGNSGDVNEYRGGDHGERQVDVDSINLTPQQAENARYVRYSHNNDLINDYGKTIGFVPKESYRIAAVIPAYNEEDDLERCLDSVYSQTLLPDLVVVVPNNCTDNTVHIAEQYARRVNAGGFGDSQMFVLELEKAEHRKPEALNNFWQNFGEQCEFFIGMDSDTVLAPECVENLYDDIVENRKAAGVMARYTFDQDESRGFLSSLLLRMQRMEFTSWTLDLMRENYETYVLGGQATIFRSSCLKQIVDHYNRFEGPWSYESDVEDMELTWRLNDRGFKTYVSKTARAYCGPMFTLKTLWAQRRKWDEGILRLMKDHDRTKYMKIPVEQDRKMWLNFIIRVLFATLFIIAFQRGAWVWFWWWALPPVFSIVLNYRIHNRMPHKTFGDTLMTLLYLPMEFYLLFRMCVWARSKIGARQQKTDRWAAQARSEGKSGGNIKTKTDRSRNFERFLNNGNVDDERSKRNSNLDDSRTRETVNVDGAQRSNRDRFNNKHTVNGSTAVGSKI